MINERGGCGVLWCEAEQCSCTGARNSEKAPLKTEYQDHLLEALICLSFLHICTLRSGALNANKLMLASAAGCRYLRLNIEKSWVTWILKSFKPVLTLFVSLHCRSGEAGRWWQFIQATDLDLLWSIMEAKWQNGCVDWLSCPLPFGQALF